MTIATPFRVRLPRRVYPALIVLLALSGCGGGGGATKTQAVRTVRGNGFSFSAPQHWEVRSSPISALAAPQGDDATLVAAYVLRTVKPYRESLWKSAAAELDRKASLLATKLRGRVASSSTTTVARSRARQYVFDYGDKRARVTFFYRRRQEYELYCRWSATKSEPLACSVLLRSFTPS